MHDASSQVGSTRRQFLGASAGVVAGSAMSQLAISPAVRAAGSDTVTVALVGCGSRGTGAVNDMCNASGGQVRLIAVADAFPERPGIALNHIRREHPDKIEVPRERQFVGLEAYKQAIDSGPDLVILATPPGFRPEQFEYAVDRGKHVFMEKPVAVDAPGVRRVLAANERAKAMGLRVGVGLQRHHDPMYIETIRRLKEGAIGDINFMRCYWNSGGVWVRTRKQLMERNPDLTEMEYQVRNWYYFAWLSGDHIVEQHIHNMDVCNWVKGAYPVRAQGQGGRQVRTGPDYGEIYDHHVVEYTYEDGTTMLSQCRHMANTWSVVGEFAHGSRGDAQISAGRINARDEAWRYREERVNPYELEHHALLHALRNNEPFNEGDNGAMSTMTAILGRMATYSGRVIPMANALASDLVLGPQRLAFDAEPPVLPDENGYYPVPMPGQTEVL